MSLFDMRENNNAYLGITVTQSVYQLPIIASNKFSS